MITIEDMLNLFVFWLFTTGIVLPILIFRRMHKTDRNASKLKYRIENIENTERELKILSFNPADKTEYLSSGELDDLPIIKPTK